MQTVADGPSEQEAWQLGWRAFLKALNVLSQEAPEQCRLMGNFNVPWELKHDLLAGEYLLANAPSSITAPQRGVLTELFRELRALPREALEQPNTIQGNLRGMTHLAWRTLRTRAKQALAEIEGRHDH